MSATTVEAPSERRTSFVSLAHLRRQWSAYLFLLPSALLIFGLIYYPILAAIRLSFFRARGLGGDVTFVGLKNYVDLAMDPLFRQILWQTVVWTAGVLGGTMLLSIGVALFLNERFRGRRLVRAIVIIPWGTSLALAAIMWRWVFEPSIGMFNEVLKSLGVIAENIGWLGDPTMAFAVVIFVGIWVSVPFTSLGLLAGLQAIPSELTDAATMDGAHGWTMIWHVILPLLRPVINVLFVLNFIGIFNSFPIIWVLTNGGPINSTDIAVTYLYKSAFKFLEFGSASAMAVIVFLILLIFSLSYMRVMGQEMHR